MVRLNLLERLRRLLRISSASKESQTSSVFTSFGYLVELADLRSSPSGWTITISTRDSSDTCDPVVRHCRMVFDPVLGLYEGSTFMTSSMGSMADSSAALRVRWISSDDRRRCRGLLIQITMST